MKINAIEHFPQYARTRLAVAREVLRYFYNMLDLVVTLHSRADAEKPKRRSAYAERLSPDNEHDKHDEECDKVARIKHEMIPLEVKKEQDAVGILCGQSLKPVLIYLCDVLYPVEKLVEKREGKKRDDEAMAV